MKMLPTPSDPNRKVTPARLFNIAGSRGIVAHHRVIWKTSVTSGGGGGYLDKGTGFISPTWTHTDHTHWQEFWIQTNDGHESHYWLQGFENVHLREGQEVGVLLANGVVTYVMNYTTDSLYPIAPLDRLLPLPAPMSGCAVAACTVFLAPCLGFALLLAVEVVIGFCVRAMFGAIPASQIPPWLITFATWAGMIFILATVAASAVFLTRRSRRIEGTNARLRTQGRAELTAACQRCLGVQTAP